MLDKKTQCGRYSKSEKKARKREKLALSLRDVNIKLSEDSLQRQCEEYIEARGLRYIHIPKAAGTLIWKASWSQRKELSYYLKDISDLIIFKPGKKYPIALVVELKVGKNKMNSGQKEFIDKVYGGIPDWLPAKTFEAFKKILDEFIG